jgi:hypothetical protein
MAQTQHWHSYVAAGTMIATGLVLTATWRRASLQPPTGSENLQAYLLDHLAGSDAALRVLTHLQRAVAGSAPGHMLIGLQREFEAERDTVRGLLDESGSMRISAKRVVAGSSGLVLGALGAGQPGDISFFRAIEGLAIGVQGKRLLWRAAQDWPASSARRPEFRRLEGQAEDQWERLDAYRRQLIRATFGETP